METRLGAPPFILIPNFTLDLPALSLYARPCNTVSYRVYNRYAGAVRQTVGHSQHTKQMRLANTFLRALKSMQ